ncbi:saccharopine dehydrogenase NADP-binding domain-containing protein [Micromonospora sp. NPDC049559]|uniref:saccharopine dehydrogenase family protein n=1 Tax=Micromonospora sp. NPDC049559 TaxID=3155923 RepID=UPI00341CA377
MRIAVYGANGFQGKLVLAELARRGIEAVLVGRDAARLRAAAGAVTGAEHAERRLAATDDPDALVAAFRGCAAVVNCAGPFSRSGHAVVRAAIAAGCHYVDTSGEQVYLRTVFDAFPVEAERAGVAVVPAANDGCVPGDLLARLLFERIGPMREITVTHLVAGGGGMSRGSLRSLAETIETLRGGGLGYDGGRWRPLAAIRYASIVPPDAPAPVDVVSLPLSEVITIPRHVPVQRVESLVEAALRARLNGPLAPEVVDTVPEGPAEAARRSQRFTYLVDGTGADGRYARGVVRGPDTYGSTAVIAVEAARRLVVETPKPGVLAPAQAYDPAGFLDFLAPYGITWSVELTTGPALGPAFGPAKPR